MKKTATQKTTPAKAEGRDKKGQVKKVPKKNALPVLMKPEGRNEMGRFIQGNQEALKWTEETVLPYVHQMWKKLTEDKDGKTAEDPITANDIKQQGHIAMKCGVKKVWWDQWKVKFTEGPVFDAIKDIEWVCEIRTAKNGTTMDIFLLKANYGYKESSHVDMTTDGKSINNPFFEFLKLTSSKEG
jgi:hypothetical protein